MKRYLPFAIIAIVFCSAIVVAALLLRAPKTNTTSTNMPGTSGSNTSTGPQPGAEPARTKGDPNAPVVIEEFGDFQCPPCAALHPELQQIEKDYGQRVRVVFRHFPLTQIHPYALEAAQVAEAAGNQGKFWEMHAWLYEHQEEWHKGPYARQMFFNAAQKMGMDVGRLQVDMNTAEVKQRVIQDYRRGISLGVQGTPTLFINGKLVTQEQMTDAGLRGMINSALAAKGQ